MKYFGNSNPKKKEDDEVEEVEEVEGHEENDKEDLNLEESSSDACVSTENKNNLSDLIETMNAIENIGSTVEPSTSKASEQNRSKSDESNLDADYNFDDCIVVSSSENENEHKNEIATSSKQSNSKSTIFQTSVTNIENLEETDYVQCKQCSKKILCWFMPGNFLLRFNSIEQLFFYSSSVNFNLRT